MPPKRKTAAPAASKGKGKQASSKQGSKLARENNISAEDELEIQEAFKLFAQHDIEDYEHEKEGVIRTQDVRRAMVALNMAPSSASELSEIIDFLDTDSTGYVTYAHFLPVCAIKLQGRTSEEKASEAEAAYRLFTRGGSGPITVAHLKRIARELNQDVSEEMLRAMVLEANGGAGVGRGVGMDDFESIMRRAGVFQ